MLLRPNHGVSGHNATDKTSMDEMPLTFVFGENIFCIGVLGVGVSTLAFCPKIKSWAPWGSYTSLFVFPSNKKPTYLRSFELMVKHTEKHIIII